MSLLSFIGLNPSPTDDYWYGPVGRRTVAGVNVDEATALTYSACWAATRLLASSGAMLPLKLFRKLPGGGAEAAIDHPLYKIIHDTPNPDMTSMMFRASRIAQQVNRGNAYAEIERDRIGRVVALHPIHASRIPPQNIRREEGRLYYYINNDNGTKTRMRAEDIFHVASPMSEDGIVGRGVVENARQSIGMGIATETQGAAFFGNSARPTMVIEGGTFKNEEERKEFRRMWAEVHGGPENNGRPAMMPKDAKLHALQWNAQDSQFLETRQHNIEEIARWYGVPPHLIGHLLRATYSNIEQQSLEFVKFSLMPWIVVWEQEIWRKLLSEADQENYYASHVVEGLERADIQTRTNALKDQFFNGSLTLNQWMALENRNPIGPVGDIHWVQQAMIPVELAAKGPQPAEPPPKEQPKDQPKPGLAADSREQEFLAAIAERLADLEAKHEAQEKARADELAAVMAQLRAERSAKDLQRQLAAAMLRDVTSRLLSVEVNAVKRVAEKPEKFVARLHEFYDKHTATLKRSLAEPVAVLLAASGDERDASAVVEAAALEHVAESLKQLDALLDCQASELAGKVDECVGKWHEERNTINLEDK